jgi:hypothetical protein
MPDDLELGPLDKPAAEPATSPSVPGPDVTGPGLHDRDHHGLSPVIAWLLVAVAGLGFIVSTPPSAGPDEPAHEVTAWYLSANGLGPSSIESFAVPAAFSVGHPCFAEKPEVTASCIPPITTAQATVSTSRVLNYPPPYYWVVGIGERLAALVGIEYADVGGRLASFLLNFGALLLLSLYMRRRNQWWGTILLLVSTPMAVFLGIVVNPSGWEITCGLMMAAVLTQAVWNSQSPGSDAWPNATTAFLVLASVALSLARPIGFFWAAGLTVSAIALAPSMNLRLLVRTACVVAPGIAVGILWYLAHPNGSPSLAPTSTGALPNIDTSLAASLVVFPLRLFEMFGNLGWLDTPMPGLLLLGNLVAWAVLLRRMPSIGRAAMLCGILGIVIFPSIIESTLSGGWPFWWQGRYTMPFALGFVLLLLLRSGPVVPRTISIVSSLSVLSLGLMVWVNAVRYDFGLNDYGLPISLAQQGISPVRLVISVAVGSLLLLVSASLAWRAWAMKPDFRPNTRNALEIEAST